MSFKQKFNIHIDKIDKLENKFDVLEILGQGAMGYIYKARDKRFVSNVVKQRQEHEKDEATNNDDENVIVLKCREKSSVKLREFQREVYYSYLLSAHENIVNTYNVAFETPTDYVMVQEVAPFGTLVNWVPRKQGLEEWPAAKEIIRQIESAIDFMHSKDVVHCDIRPENILVFQHELYEPCSESRRKDSKARREEVNKLDRNDDNQVCDNHKPLFDPNHQDSMNHTNHLFNSLALPSILKRSSSFTSLFSPNKRTIPPLTANAKSYGGSKRNENVRKISLSPGVLVNVVGHYWVKLAGFDKALKRGTLIKKLAKANSYSAPEICDVFYKEGYVVEPSADIWAFGILVYYILTGMLPWVSAIEDSDPDFTEFVWWLKRKRLTVPAGFKMFTEKLCKYFRKVFEIKRDKRCSIRDINKYMTEPWKRQPPIESTKFRSDSVDGMLMDPIIAAHQRSTHHLPRFHQRKPRADDYEPEDASTESDSVRQQIEEFESHFSKHGVQIDIDKINRNDRIQNWLKNNPSDASLPNMGESCSSEEEEEGGGGGGEFIPSRISNFSRKTFPTSSHEARGSIPSKKYDSVRKQPKYSKYFKPYDYISDGESASTTKPTKLLNYPFITENLLKSGEIDDDWLGKSTVSGHRTPKLTPRVSLDNSSQGLAHKYKTNNNSSRDKPQIGTNPYEMGDLVAKLPKEQISLRQMPPYIKDNTYISNNKKLLKDSNNTSSSKAPPPPPVTIFLEQASSESTSDE